MGTQNVLKRNSATGGLIEETTVESSAGAGDDGKLVSLDATGRLNNNMMPTGIGQASFVLDASEALSAGDFVNIFWTGSVRQVRKADASNGFRADGFVTAAVVISTAATVFYGDQNDQLASLNQDDIYFLGDAGAVTNTAPSTSGDIVQYLGKPVSDTSLIVEIGIPITIA